MERKKIGIVSNYYANISVAAVDISDGMISVGDKLHFYGHTTDFEPTVLSMQWFVFWERDSKALRFSETQKTV